MKIKLLYIFIGAILFSFNILYGQNLPDDKKKLIFQDDFREFDSTLWKAEIAPLPNSSVGVRNRKLLLDTQGGVTVWFKKLLTDNIEIRYNWTVKVDGGENDRLSDLNQFWMATDLRKDNLFTRHGVLEEYDSLSLYYVGMGGNSNTTTRLRKYPGNGQRVLIEEYKDKRHLLTANHSYQIRIIVKKSVTEFWVDGEKYFSFYDSNPLTRGYFGFRSTKARHEISNFRVYRLSD